MIWWKPSVLLGIIYLASPTDSATQNTYKRVCYVSSWSRYRPSAVSFKPENIEAHLCTHLIYAFITLDHTGTQLQAFDPKDGATIYNRLNALKAKNPQLKTLVSVGGWAMGSDMFSLLVSNQHNRMAFAQNAITYLRDNFFDGLDIDWEYPAARGSPSGDKHKFTQLIQTVQHAFQQEAHRTGRPRLLLTAALAPSPFRVNSSYDAVQLARSLDFINLMTYEIHGEWEKPLLTGHHSALYGTPQDPYANVDYMAKYWSGLGIPKQKLLIGLPFYGKSLALNNTAVHGVRAPAYGPGEAGKYTHENGVLAYFEVCDLLRKGAHAGVIANTSAPYLVDHGTWASYDNIKSLQEKVKYVIDNGYGGIMVWTLDLDDFSGMCGKPYPLMNAVKTAFNHVIG